MSADPLFAPLNMGALALPNRILMAPLTRCRAEDDHVPGPLMAEYYAQRASAGLIIAEATMAMPNNSAFWREPGIHSEAQVAGWKRVTDAVHAKGGRIARGVGEHRRLTLTGTPGRADVEVLPDRPPEPRRMVHRPLPELLVVTGRGAVAGGGGGGEPAPRRFGTAHRARRTPRPTS